MQYQQLRKFISEEMRMSQVYQPVMLMQLLKNNGDRINQMSDFSAEEKKNFLRGVIERIGVQTLDKQTHELHLKFRIPCVNDLLLWNSKTDKKKGYTIKDGVTDISVEIDTGKKSPKLRK